LRATLAELAPALGRANGKAVGDLGRGGNVLETAITSQTRNKDALTEDGVGRRGRAACGCGRGNAQCAQRAVAERRPMGFDSLIVTSHNSPVARPGGAGYGFHSAGKASDFARLGSSSD
jgi:hypothetical protein